MEWMLNSKMTDAAKRFFEEMPGRKVDGEQLDKFVSLFRTKLGFDITAEMTVKEHMFWRNCLSGRSIAKTCTSIEKAMYRVSDFDKPMILERFWKNLSKQEKREWLLKTWLDNDSTMLHGFNWWIKKFRSVGFFTNCNVQPKKPIKLYRGCINGLEKGLSWTDDIEIARMYACQEVNKGHITSVFEVTVHPMNVLAVLKVKGITVNHENNFAKGLETQNYFENLEYILDLKNAVVRPVEWFDLQNIEV